MKVKNYPCLLTDEELKAEIKLLELRRPFSSASKSAKRWAKRLFILRQELKRRQQITPPAEAAQ